jgi:nitrogen fixation/metabolism regulation signal transduction histidine kinase
MFLSWLVVNTKLYANMIFVFSLIVLQSFSLFKFINRVNHNFVRFIEAIKTNDLTFKFSNDKISQSLKVLYFELNDAIENLKNKDISNESERLFLESIIKNIGIGLIAFNYSGQIKFLNMEARRLLNIGPIESIEELDTDKNIYSKQLYDIAPGEKRVLDYQLINENIKFTLVMSEIFINNKTIKILMIQNITNELDTKEIEAWHQLIKVMSHEIINSVAPIASLASSSKKIMDKNSNNGNGSNIKWEKDDLNDLSIAISTIEKRSLGLQKFVSSYRKLNRIPNPEFKNIIISDLFERVYQLIYNSDKLSEKVQFRLSVNPPNLEVTADPDLLEHVLLNLLYNSIDAIKTQNNPILRLNAHMNKLGSIIISVVDNGTGIDKNDMASIFTPFYTTKKEGTGLGLSLSKQIIKLHGGQLDFKSEPGVETKFTIKF